MENNKFKTIANLFENKEVRSIWDSEKEEYYFSVVDVISALTQSSNPRKYWSVLKNRLVKEGSEVTTKCSQLKMMAPDGKLRLRDALDTKGIFRLIESIPSSKAEPFKLWLANLGSEFAMLTNEIYKGWSGMKASEYKVFKGIRKESLRDNMTDIEVLLTDLGEVATRDIASSEKPYGLDENMKIAARGGKVAKGARDLYEQETKRKAISKQNVLDYQYVDNNELIEQK